MKYDVFGLGNPLIDIILRVEDDFLCDLGLEKGSMNLVDPIRQQEIQEKAIERSQAITLGGSCANTMVMISQLGGKAAFGGKVGNDNLAAIYEDQLITNGVDAYLAKEPGTTGSTIILVSPDAERTMNTNLGMSQSFDETDLDISAIQSAIYLYVEGYLWDTAIQKRTVLSALKTAQAAEIKIALTLSDSFCVERHRDEFLRLMKEYIDILFCNETEAQIISGEYDTDRQLSVLAEDVDHIVLTLGINGSIIYYQGKTTTIDPIKVDAIDTTGAGDAYAAGYLYGLTHQYSIEQAGKLAAGCAATIVTQNGPRVMQGNFRSMVGHYLID
jgi:sugar/nucleoside kinase (ribokinase family)